MIKSLLLIACSCCAFQLLSQDLLADPEAEEKFRSQTKQVNQFFRRFNGEEDVDGNRFYEGNKDYRDPKLRQQYIAMLFDDDNLSINTSLKKDFIKQVTDKKEGLTLDFHKEGWFAEVNTNFIYKGRNESITLFLKIQPQRLGFEWVIYDVSFQKFSRAFNKDTTASKQFIHPMSHELDFMNLRKALLQEGHPEAFTSDDFMPDYVTLFLYELKQGNLKFQTVVGVKFHFFQINGWYFELSNFNRPGYNTGWLISNLVSVNKEEEQMLKEYIYGKN